MLERLRYLYRAYRYRWRVDPAEIRFMCQKLQPGATAVDVGCHKGAYTYWMRRRVGPLGTVIAFEPQPRQAAYLRETFEAMAYHNVRVEPVGVSDRSGQMQLSIPSAAGATHGASFVAKQSEGDACETIDVRVTTLDAYFASGPAGPDFLKIDVEGHESAVLDGARETLAAHRPTLLIECEARHRAEGDVRPVLELLVSLGYEGSFFCDGRRRPLSEFDPLQHQRHQPGEKLPAGYVNNFAFEHAGRGFA